jgi:integrase
VPTSDQLACNSNATTSKTIAELRAALLADTALSATRQRDMVSALNALAKALGKPAEIIPTQPALLRPQLDRLTPAMVGLKPGRWRNVQSLLGTALAHAGIVTIQGRLRTEPSADWMAILSLLPSHAGRHFHLWRFARWCTGRDIAPDAVSDTTLETYRLELETRSLVSGPDRAVREVARFWNEAAGTHTAWPQRCLTIRNNRRDYAPDWAVYPDSLRADAEAWCAGLGDDDPFADRAFTPLKPASVESRRKQLRVYLAALVQQGTNPADLTDLAAAVTPTRAPLALRFFWDRAGRKATTHTYHIASLVLMIARHWARLPQPEVDRLAGMARQLRPEPVGLAGRNLARIRQFEDPTKLDAVLVLPHKLARRVEALGTPSKRTALEMQTAVALEILLHVPLRLANLRGLRIGTHLHRRAGDVMAMSIDGKEVKNGTPVEATLSTATVRLIARYIDVYRPLLATGRSDFLFPGIAEDEPKSDPGMRTQLQDALAHHVGVDLNPHGFRHLAAYLILRDNPSAHGQVQRVLGHKSLATTMAFYSGLEAIGAFASYDALIARQREGAAEKKHTRRGSR